MSYGLKQTSSTKASDLTRLELIGLTLAAHGLSASEAASRLSVTDAQIQAALHSAEMKLGASNRMQAIAVAVQRGLIGIEVKG